LSKMRAAVINKPEIDMTNTLLTYMGKYIGKKTKDVIDL